MRLVFSRVAIADLDEILDFSIKIWGVDRGFDYVTEIRNRAMQLTDGLHPGSAASDVAPKLRRLVSGSHVILFQRDQDQVLILRILHQSRDVGRWLG